VVRQRKREFLHRRNPGKTVNLGAARRWNGGGTEGETEERWRNIKQTHPSAPLPAYVRCEIVHRLSRKL